MKVGIIGVHGRMGRAIRDAIQHDDELDLVAGIDRDDDLADLARAGVEVAVDVTVATSARSTVPWLALHGIDAVVGTSGLTDDDIARLDDAFKAQSRRCFLVPNFSIGAVLLMRFAEQAAPHFQGVEIIEMHHDGKKDAPSGTATLTAQKLASARSEPWNPDPTEHVTAASARGGEVEGIRVHSVRLPGLLAHQEVLFGTTGETLTIRHDSFDRSSFMPGVIMAVKGVRDLAPGVTRGLEHVLPAQR